MIDQHEHTPHSEARPDKAAMPEHGAHPDGVDRMRGKHQRRKLGKKRFKRKKRRFIFWAQIFLVSFLLISIGLTIRAMEIVSMKGSGTSWLQEIEQGNYDVAADKFSILASDAVDYVFDANLSIEGLLQDLNAALPHLKKAGYTLTELEVEIGIPPKLIPHFYRDPRIKLDVEQALASLKGNSIGSALLMALAEAGRLQQEMNVSGMQFSHIEVELGPIPALKIQYKNDAAIESYIHRD
ncbi:MAG: hypothetical protein JKY87_04865 [Mariprofundus sp.]|nr:hypothetical protein [Mariprofundus sp.]